MENLSNLRSGMNSAYRAVRGTLICLLLTWVPSLKLFAAFGIWVFIVWYMVGLYRAGKDIERCRRAFILSVVSIIMAVLSMSPFGFISIPVSIVRYGVEFLIVYLVCISVSEVTERMGAIEVKKEGTMAWQVNAVCFGLVAVISILELVLFFCGTDIRDLSLLANMLISLLAKVFYMSFLKSCDQALNGGRKKQETD